MERRKRTASESDDFTQEELQCLRAVEEMHSAMRAAALDRLLGGAATEPGPLRLNPRALKVRDWLVIGAAETLGVYSGSIWGMPDLLSVSDPEYLQSVRAGAGQLRGLRSERYRLFVDQRSHLRAYCRDALRASKRKMNAERDWRFRALFRDHLLVSRAMLAMWTAALLYRARSARSQTIARAGLDAIAHLFRAPVIPIRA